MRARLAFLASLVLGFVALAGAQPPLPPGNPGPPPPAPGGLPLPPGAVPVAALPVVPMSAGAFVTLKVSDVLSQPDLKPVLTQLAKQPDALDGLTEAVGVSPLEIDRVTLFWPQSLANGPDGAILVVTTVKPYNEARVLKALHAQPVSDADRGHKHGGFGGAATPRTGIKAAEPDIKNSAPPPAQGLPTEPQPEDSCAPAPADEPGDPLFYALRHGPFEALFLIDDRTLMFIPEGAEFAGMALLAATLKKSATGPLAEALADAGRHTFAAGVNLKPLFGKMDRTPPELAPYTALFAARSAVVTGDLGPSAKLALTLKFEDAAKAKRAAPVLEEGIAAVAEKAGKWADELKDSHRPLDRASAPLAAAFVGALKKSTVKAADASVAVGSEMDAGPVVAKALGEMLVAVQSRKKAQARVLNLKQIGLALHAYQDVNGKLPANVYGPKGELLLSWRVQLLPFLEEEALYRQFKMDEPWDSANNKPLIEKMPKVYQAPDRAGVKGMTYYQGFVSPAENRPQPKGVFGHAWLREGEKNGIGLISGIPDGTSNTLAVVEARDGVIWSKPADLPFGGAVPPLGEKGSDRGPALRFDGSAMLFPNGLTAEQFWAFVSVNGGDVTEDPDERRPGRFDRPPAAAPPATATQPPVVKEPKSPPPPK